MLRITQEGQAVPLYQGRCGNRFHIGVRRFPGEAPRFALCSADLPYKTRPQAHYELTGEKYLCAICRRRAEKNGMHIEEKDD